MRTRPLGSIYIYSSIHNATVHMSISQISQYVNLDITPYNHFPWIPVWYTEVVMFRKKRHQIYNTAIWIEECLDKVFDIWGFFSNLCDTLSTTCNAGLLLSCHLACINSSYLSDAMWQHKSGSILAQVRAWCHQATSDFLNQCWLYIKGRLWQSPDINITRGAHET